MTERSKNRILVVIVALFSALAITTVFVCSEVLKAGIMQGLLLCFSVVIPSLFVFTAISLFIANSGILVKIGRFTEKFSIWLFGLDGQQFSCFILSLVSGYPTGARIIADLYERKQISLQKGKLMLLYSINAGPAFIVTAVGSFVLHSRSDGVRLLIAHILSSVIMALVTARFMKNNDLKQNTEPISQPQQKIFIADSFVTSVTNSAVTMLNVCSFVVIFSGLGSILSSLPIGSQPIRHIRSLLEVTVGIQGCTRKQLEETAFYLGFGGISVLCQVTSAAKALRPSFLKLLFSRLIHGSLSAAVIYVLEKLFPRYLATVSFGNPVSKGSITTSPIASIALIFLSIVLICFVGRKKVLK